MCSQRFDRKPTVGISCDNMLCFSTFLRGLEMFIKLNKIRTTIINTTLIIEIIDFERVFYA